MDITPQDNTQPISDDQELAKALAGVLPEDDSTTDANSPTGLHFEETAAPAAPAAIVPPAPAPVAPVAAITCPEGTREMRMIRQIAMPDAPVQTLRISTCAPDARATRAMVMRSLAAARGTIAVDPDIPADVRRKILEALDHRMADLPAAAPLS